MLDDCEYGTVTLDVIAVRETRDEALSAIGKVIFALYQADWECYDNDALSIRSMGVVGIPEVMTHDGGGRWLIKAELESELYT